MSPLAVDCVRVSWLTLVGMMLLSRVVFQRAGPEWMRAFLDTWKNSRTKRIWAALVLATFAALVPVLWRDWPALKAFERVLAGLLLAVLFADGFLNALPSGFRTFKDRMQEAWVRRHPRVEDQSDRAMFAKVNLLLAALSLAMGLAVVLYRPITTRLVILSVVLALILTFGLLHLTLREQRSGTR
ncbi:hypothetical protein RAS2_08300 [Phycisphaerae bacterium RAS2]|nr:hypothetical protein RAS2_08300 [Phycisphaerae bacterium RAS2]